MRKCKIRNDDISVFQWKWNLIKKEFSEMVKNITVLFIMQSLLLS